MTHLVNGSIIVQGDVSHIFNLWADFENFPKFMKHIKSVERTGDNSSRWIAAGPLGIHVAWNAEITRFEQNRRIACLNEIIEALHNSRRVYDTAAEDVRFVEYHKLLKQYAEQRTGFITEVEQEVQQLGGTPEQSGSLSGKLHQGWIELKSIATGQDEGAMLNECALNEKMMLDKYGEALQRELPQNARLVLTRQHRLSQETLEHLEKLQEEAPYPGKLP